MLIYQVVATQHKLLPVPGRLTGSFFSVLWWVGELMLLREAGPPGTLLLAVVGAVPGEQLGVVGLKSEAPRQSESEADLASQLAGLTGAAGAAAAC